AMAPWPAIRIWRDRIACILDSRRGAQPGYYFSRYSVVAFVTAPALSAEWCQGLSGGRWGWRISRKQRRADCARREGKEDSMERVDTLVIGSGFGGAVMALRLAEKGAKVVVLERGRRWTPAEYPSVSGRHWWWDEDAPERQNGWI